VLLAVAALLLTLKGQVNRLALRAEAAYRRPFE